jgi:2-keto-4-pentenoate hydratase/2-oxohepta-3-ene-1,7-dioic acid hydratase in catechol pathway
MKICRFNNNKLGLVEGDDVYDVSTALERIPAARWPFPKGDQLIANLPAVVDAIKKLERGKPACKVAEAKFQAPVANPMKIVAAPVNYKAHVDESIADTAINFGRVPLPIADAGLFLKATTSLIGPGETMKVRFPERRTDHEVELVLVIGKQCSDVTRDDALDYVAGYAIGLDMSVRGKEDRSFRKSLDTYSVLGPWLVTADEIPNPDSLALKLTVNGKPRQESNTNRLLYDVRKLIEWASQWYTLYPGDILYTGTPEGVGPVQAGDTMECTIESIGSMTVNVAGWP